jgi:uncharacterized protein (TIGR02611 family)
MPSRKPNTGWKRWFSPQYYASQPKNGAARLAKRIFVSVLGFSVIIVGILMIVTPGPAIVVIPAGLAILAVEFAWARRWLRRLKAYHKLWKNRRAQNHSKLHPPTRIK